MADALPTHSDVVVIGGGITGLAMATALGNCGKSITVLEARGLPDESAIAVTGESPSDYDPRVSALTERSMAFLQSIGAWETVDAQRHCPYTHMTVWDGEGTASIEFDADEVSAKRLGSIVENRVILAGLTSGARSASGLRICAPASVAEIAPTNVAGREGVEGPDDHEHLITLTSGEQIRCGLLIAADGGLSPSRELLGMATREWDYGHRAIVTTVEFEKPHQNTAWQRFLQSGPLALLPLPHSESRCCSIVWSIDEAKADDLLALDDREFALALSDASERCLGEVFACSPRQAFPLRQRHALDYVVPGAALIGDAAHTIHPLAGQGVNLGLADAEVLSGEVKAAWARGSSAGDLRVLKRYQRQRKGDNLTMMAAMDGFKRLFEQDAPAFRWLRNTGMRGVASVPLLKRQIIRQAMGVGAAAK